MCRDARSSPTQHVHVESYEFHVLACLMFKTLFLARFNSSIKQPQKCLLLYSTVERANAMHPHHIISKPQTTAQRFSPR